MTFTAYVLLGTNLGDRSANLELARTHINKSVGKISKLSKIYETEAWGKTNQPAFFNQIIMVSTSLSPFHLLNHLLEIELEIGRVRYEKWGERIIDIDILYFENKVINTPDLVIPHPEIQNRKFTLVPLDEIATDLLHPVLKKSSKELLEICQDRLDVRPIINP